MSMPVIPTKGNLLAIKKSLDLARVGFELLDRKRNILVREMMMLIKTAEEVQSKIDITYSRAYKALQMANITLGNCENLANTVPIDESIKLSLRSVMGVEIPMVSSLPNKNLAFSYGFYSSNSMLDEAVRRFVEVKDLTLALAEIENSVYRLATAIGKTQKRANALKNVVIPRFESNVKFISEALEEKDREEFSRLKVIKKNKNSKEN